MRGLVAVHVIGDGPVPTGTNLHSDRVEIGRLKIDRPESRVGVQREGGTHRCGGDDRRQRVQQVLQDEGRGHTRRHGPGLGESQVAVVLDPAGREVDGPCEGNAQVRVTLVGDSDREEGQMPIELRDRVAQLDGSG